MLGPSLQKHSTFAIFWYSVSLLVVLGALFRMNSLFLNYDIVVLVELAAFATLLTLSAVLLFLNGELYDVFGPPCVLTDIVLRPGVIGADFFLGLLPWLTVLYTLAAT